MGKAQRNSTIILHVMCIQFNIYLFAMAKKVSDHLARQEQACATWIAMNILIRAVKLASKS